MSRRTVVQSTRRESIPGAPKTSHVLMAVTADVRVAWPCGSGSMRQALDALDLAYIDAKRQILAREREVAR